MMCCESDTVLWFALSVFRIADIIGIDGHVSFLPPKDKEKRSNGDRQAMKDAELVALAEAQWIRSYVRLRMGSGVILGAPPL